MERPIFQLQQSVQEVLTEHPEANRGFRTLRTQCVGCYLARFCNLEDVARTFEIPPDRLVAELEAAVLQSYTPSRRNE